MVVILDVDDELPVLSTRYMILSSAGYDVLSAASGQEGLRLLSLHNPDLVLLDYRMPGMDGGVVAMEIRRQRPALPIIMVSAYVDQPEVVRHTVDVFVEKGSGPQFLLEKIAEVLAKKSTAKGAAAESTVS